MFALSYNSDKRFYPVIHCVDPFEKKGIGHALVNTRIAIENGADGVFLIGHNMVYVTLFNIYEQVRKHFHTTWIGLNFLDISNNKMWGKLSCVANCCSKLNALWVDDMLDERLTLPSTMQIFGGVAFKYIDPHQSSKDLEVACKKAIRCVDVATTSGDATGSAPEVAKLEAIKKNLEGKIPLALASGVNSKNVLDFRHTVDKFLVASSICERKHELGNNEYLVPEKVMELAELIHR